MNTIEQQIQRFEQIQREIAILGMLGSKHYESDAKKLFDELEAMNLNGKPKLKLIKGGRYNEI